MQNIDKTFVLTNTWKSNMHIQNCLFEFVCKCNGRILPNYKKAVFLLSDCKQHWQNKWKRFRANTKIHFFWFPKGKKIATNKKKKRIYSSTLKTITINYLNHMRCSMQRIFFSFLVQGAFCVCAICLLILKICTVNRMCQNFLRSIFEIL